MNVAFCINPMALIGFGVTVSSLIRNCSCPKKLHFWFLCAKLTQDDKQRIKWLLDHEKFDGTYLIIDFDPIQLFSSLRSLHGDWTTYGRLLLPDIVTGTQVLYLDSDLVVELDVLNVDNYDFKGLDLAAVRGGTLKTELEQNFYLNKLRLSPEADSFNAGVLILNLLNWRSKNLKDKCLKLASNYPNDLLSCDQSILNALFAGSFSWLPPSLNIPWYTEKSRPDCSEKIVFHFVGSPKPWDLFGSIIHKGYGTWKKYLVEEWSYTYGRFNFISFKRAWKIRRSYLRTMLKYFRL